MAELSPMMKQYFEIKEKKRRESNSFLSFIFRLWATKGRVPSCLLLYIGKGQDKEKKKVTVRKSDFKNFLDNSCSDTYT